MKKTKKQRRLPIAGMIARHPAIGKTFDVWLACDGCHGMNAVKIVKKKQQTARTALKKLEARAESVGWKRDIRGLWFCPRCDHAREA